MIDWPTTCAFFPSNSVFYLRPAGTISQSPYTGSLKAVSAQALWIAEYTLFHRKPAENIDLQGFLAELDGPASVVNVLDFHRREPQLLAGTAYSPLVAVAGAAKENSVTIKDLPLSTDCFKRGEIVEIGGYCYQLRTDQASDGSGEATLLIKPGLRQGVAVDDPVTIYTPRCKMRWANSTDFQVSSALVYGDPVTLRFVEDVA